jgi:hypothetical protein
VDDIQAVVKILPECITLGPLEQMAVRRRNHADVDCGVRDIGADALDLAMFEKPEEAPLKAVADRADVGHEDRAAVRLFQETSGIAIRAVHAAEDMSEQLGLEQHIRHRRAIDRQKSPDGTLTVPMNQLGERSRAGSA